MKKLLLLMLFFPTCGTAQELILFRAIDTTFWTTLQYTPSSFAFKEYPVIIDSYNLREPMLFKIADGGNISGINLFLLTSEKKDTLYFSVFKDENNIVMASLFDNVQKPDLFRKSIIMSRQANEFKNEFSDLEYESLIRMLAKNLENYGFEEDIEN